MAPIMRPTIEPDCVTTFCRLSCSTVRGTIRMSNGTSWRSGSLARTRHEQLLRLLCLKLKMALIPSHVALQTLGGCSAVFHFLSPSSPYLLSLSFFILHLFSSPSFVVFHLPSFIFLHFPSTSFTFFPSLSLTPLHLFAQSFPFVPSSSFTFFPFSSVTFLYLPSFIFLHLPSLIVFHLPSFTFLHLSFLSSPSFLPSPSFLLSFFSFLINLCHLFLSFFMGISTSVFHFLSPSSPYLLSLSFIFLHLFSSSFVHLLSSSFLYLPSLSFNFLHLLSFTFPHSPSPSCTILPLRSFIVFHHLSLSSFIFRRLPSTSFTFPPLNSSSERDSLGSVLHTGAGLNGADYAPEDIARVRVHVLQAIVQYGSQHHPHVERDVMTKWHLSDRAARAVIAACLVDAEDGIDPEAVSLANTGWV
jgi:hypothetical protein